MHIFENLKIIDLTRVFSGPFATRHFSDFGADVIKIEPPQGDDTRKFPPIVNGFSGYFELLNRGKKSLVLDLKSEVDLFKFYSLCKDCDVVVENYSPSVKEKLKIDYKVLKKINPKIIYVSINGISKNIDRKYYDVIAQAESGLISLNGIDEDMKISTSIVDAFTGMKTAYAISSALYYREKTSTGLQINVSMRGSAFDLLEQNLIEASITNVNPSKVGNMDNAIAPFGVFKTRDGSIVVACGNDNLFHKLSIFLNVSDDLNNKYFSCNADRLKNIQLLIKTIEDKFSNYSTDDLKKILDDLGVPCGKVMTMLDILNDKENFEEKLLKKINHEKLGNVVEPSGGIFYE